MNGSRDGRSSWSSDKSNGRPRFSKITRWMPATSCQTWNLTYHPVMLSKLLFGCDQGRELTIIENRERPEIVEYLQRYSSFSVQNGTSEISLPFAKLSSFQSLISRKQLREIEVQMVSAISFGWFFDFGKTLTIIQRSSQLVYSDKW